jgi:hypothetical protein
MGVTAAIIAAIAGTAGVGASIYGTVQGANNTASEEAANKAEMTQQQQAQANQANLSKQEAVLGAQGQTQAQTGGSLTDSGTAALTDLLAGYPGYQSGSASPSSGGTGTTPSASSAIAPTSLSPGGGGGGGTPDIAAILAALRNGGSGGFGGPGGSSISGGNWQSQPAQPQPWQELSNPVLG